MVACTWLQIQTFGTELFHCCFSVDQDNDIGFSNFDYQKVHIVEGSSLGRYDNDELKATCLLGKNLNWKLGGWTVL